jgi:hypothetical protein
MRNTLNRTWQVLNSGGIHLPGALHSQQNQDLSRQVLVLPSLARFSFSSLPITLSVSQMQLLFPKAYFLLASPLFLLRFIKNPFRSHSSWWPHFHHPCHSHLPFSQELVQLCTFQASWRSSIRFRQKPLSLRVWPV